MNKKIAASLFAGIITFSCFTGTGSVNCTVADSTDVTSEASVSETTAVTHLSEGTGTASISSAVTETGPQYESASETLPTAAETTVSTIATTIAETTTAKTITTVENKQPEIEIIAPTSFILSLDPFMINHSDSQIASDNFYFINNSCTPVTVTVKLKLDCSEDVCIMDTKSFITASENDKKIWLGAVQSCSHSYNAENTAPVFDYGDITLNDETNTSFFNTDKELSFTFTLSEKGSDSSTTGFRFLGTLSESMAWSKEDVCLNMSYCVNA